ncbi:MAG TPA: SDR family oxidoreductase [Rudaea sp.]|jgi:3-oxoacyl-[acyl-carrier protein] reductase|nr:SDR family oxidoreductase [Rudaea sp.]
MDLDLSGKHALVCGGSHGIGKAAAIELAALGANVTLLSRTEASLKKALSELTSTGGQKHDFIAVDMNDHAALAEKVSTASKGDPILIVVNNTGGPPGGQADAAKVDEFTIAFAQHLLANHTILQAVLPGMKAAKYGRIINVISTSVKEPIKNLGVSNTIRAAVASWSKTLAGELGGFGITVNNVLPGYTKTARLEQILGDRAKATQQDEAAIEKSMLATVPAGRFADAHEIGNVIAFLATPAAGYINGINVPVDGGRTQSL